MILTRLVGLNTTRLATRQPLLPWTRLVSPRGFAALGSGVRLSSTSSTRPDATSHPILKRIPKFLRPYTTQFINAPFSHVTSFLILHELSAIVPLVGIWWLLHKYHITLPMDLPTWAIDKGTKIIDDSLAGFDFSSFTVHDKFTLIMEGAYAYVIVKFLLPVRIMFSLVLMPWFARWFVLPFTRLFKKRTPHPKPADPAPGVKKITKPRL